MGREFKFRGTFGLSPQPVAGVTLYQDKNSTAKPLDEVLDEAEKEEVLSARKDVLVSKLRQKEAAIRNPKRFNVDPETGVINIDEEGGQFTQGEAMMISASIKGKAGQYDAAIALINTAKELGSTNQPSVAERPKEFLVDPETGAITRDPENGEYTLSEARTISYSIQKGKQPPQPEQKSFLDKLEEITQGAISQRIAAMLSGNNQPQPRDPVKELTERLDEVDKLKQRFAPAEGTSAQSLAQSGIRGEILKMLLEDERERLKLKLEHDTQVERNKHLGTIASTVKENLGDGVRALRAAAAEYKAGSGTAATQSQAYECGQCHTRFTVPQGVKADQVGCPNCGAVYTREQLEAP